ncbi:MAG: MG2 domain-containing protein [Phycisphaerae bacterium]|nr:MG2 domain-containing protein [Phycisphaerae bacterium]
MFGCKRILKSRVFWFVAVVVVLAAAFFFASVARYGPDPQETMVLGQSSLFADSTAAFRILVRDHVKLAPIAGAKVKMVIAGQGRRAEIGDFTTDADGSLFDSVHVPSLAPGKYELTVESVSAVGKDRIVQPLWIERTSRVYVTTDKPVYQPGQTIHMRALALDRVSLKPVAAQPILFEVTDAQGNKVFKADLTTSAHGIAFCDFTLATEVNLGNYHVRVTTGKVESDRVVRVQRYVLPRFKIGLTTDKPFYLRSEKVHGEVRADYFFGKPVANAEVRVTGRTLDISAEEIFTVTGATDPNGIFRFDAACSERPGNERSDDSAGLSSRRRDAAREENTPFEIEVTAKDRTGHEETAVERRTLAGQGIDIHVFPEGGSFLKGVENILYILTAYPTGHPAVCRVEVNGAAFQSDSLGVTIFKTRLDAPGLTLDVKARDDAGLTGDWTDEIVAWGLSNDLRLRTDKAVYRLGEKPQITVLSPWHRATFFLDVLRHGQTVLTRTLPANDQGQMQMALDLPGDLWGTLELKAYTVTAGTRIDMETRVIYVRGADELRIETSVDKAVFRPGETVQAHFQVADSGGRPVPAALSLAAVDEAVFYVCENQPGRLDQFFLADGKLPLSGYQMAFAISPAKLLSGEEQYQNLAQALFSVYGRATGRNREDENRREGADRQVYETYRGIDHQGYTLCAESRSQKLAEAAAFRHRYLHVPLVSLAVLAVLMVVLGALIVLARSLFRLFRQMAAEECDDGQRLTPGAVERRVHVLAFAVLLPLVTYLDAVVLTSLLDSYRAEDRFSLDPRLLGVLMVVLSALATSGFPLVYRFGTTPFRRLGKAAFKVLSLPLLCIGLVYGVTYVAAKAIIGVCGSHESDAYSFLSLVVPVALCLGLCWRAGVASRRPPGGSMQISGARGGSCW